jgi:cyclophilin family peptidyl-prolyl cis-trans isomerase
MTLAAVLVAGLAGPAARADVRIRFGTDFGEFDVWLLEDDAPQHVYNFLAYLEDGDYDNSIFHRLVPGFVLQGGGFRVDPPIVPEADFLLQAVPRDPAIPNEFGRTNSAGTLALAKSAGNPSSGTSQFFVNLADNGPGSPANLDEQNGGFTVFGCLADPTLAVPLAINEVDVVDVSSSFGGDFAATPFENYVPPGPGEIADAREIVDFDVTRLPRVEGPCPGCNRKTKGRFVARLDLGDLGRSKQVPDVRFKLHGDHWTARGEGIDLRGTMIPRAGSNRKFDLAPDACGMEGVRSLLAELGSELVGEGFTATTDDPAPTLRAKLNKRKTKWIVRAEWAVTGSDGGDPIPGTLVLKTRARVRKLD